MKREFSNYSDKELLNKYQASTLNVQMRVADVRSFLTASEVEYHAQLENEAVKRNLIKVIR